jgi:thymidine kinase
MTREGREGSIEVITGVMFSGKSEELLRRVRRAMIARRKVQVFKSQLDDRYGGIHTISSHDGREVEARPVSNSRDVAEFVEPDTEVLAVDEVQFMDAGIVEVANELADRGVRVIVSGTDMDFRGLPFGPLGSLLAVAEKIDKLHAICVVCGDLATRNQRLIDGRPAPAEGPTIQVGGLESYEARCRAHHLVPSRLDDQMPLISEAGDES